MFQLTTHSIICLFAITFINSGPAYAYLDPSTITAASQLLAAVCTWAVLGLMFFRNHFLNLFSKAKQFIQSSRFSTAHTKKSSLTEQKSIPKEHEPLEQETGS